MRYIKLVIVFMLLFGLSQPAYAGAEEMADGDEESQNIIAVETQPTVTPSLGEEATDENEGSQDTDLTETPTEVIPPAEESIKVGKVKHLKSKKTKVCSTVLRWNKASKAKKYEVYKWNKKKSEWVLVKKTKKTHLKIKGLKCHSTYKFKVRGFTKDSGKVVYGDWSKKAKVKTKWCQQHKIFKLAKTKLGCSYQAGAKGPNAFCCTGFVYWVYKNAGVKVKKGVPMASAGGLGSELKKYQVSKPKLGDIVLFKNGGGFTHAAIYAGGGKVIHATNPARGVCITDASWSSGTRYYFRVLKADN